MSPQTRFALSLLTGLVSSLLIIFPLFPYAYWIGLCLMVAVQQIRKPFHNYDPNTYPVWFKYVTLAPWLLLIALFLVPREAQYFARVLFGISIAALTISFSYFDYLTLKKGPSSGAIPPPDNDSQAR